MKIKIHSGKNEEQKKFPSAYANLNFGIPYTFLVLLDTFENVLQFFDNSKIFLSFRFKNVQKKVVFLRGRHL